MGTGFPAALEDSETNFVGYGEPTQAGSEQRQQQLLQTMSLVHPSSICAQRPGKFLRSSSCGAWAMASRQELQDLIPGAWMMQETYYTIVYGSPESSLDDLRTAVVCGPSIRALSLELLTVTPDVHTVYSLSLTTILSSNPAAAWTPNAVCQALHLDRTYARPASSAKSSQACTPPPTSPSLARLSEANFPGPLIESWVRIAPRVSTSNVPATLSQASTP